MTDLVTPGTLGELADRPDTTPVVLLGGSEAVVLGRTADGDVSVYQAGAITGYPATTPVAPLMSATNRLDVLERAVRDLAQWRRAAVAEAEELRAILPRIRAYVIERHREGHIDRNGLNQSLHTFDLPEYEPRLKVSYTITGSFLVDGTDRDNARQAIDELGVHLPAWSDIDADSSDYRTQLDDVELVDAGADEL